MQILGNAVSSMGMMVRLSQLEDAGEAKDEQSALAKAFTTARMRESVALGRSILGGNGIVTDYEMAKIFADAEAIYSYEGTHEINTLVTGRAITGHFRHRLVPAAPRPAARSSQTQPPAVTRSAGPDQRRSSTDGRRSMTKASGLTYSSPRRTPQWTHGDAAAVAGQQRRPRRRPCATAAPPQRAPHRFEAAAQPVAVVDGDDRPVHHDADKAHGAGCRRGDRGAVGRRLQIDAAVTAQPRLGRGIEARAAPPAAGSSGQLHPAGAGLLAAAAAGTGSCRNAGLRTRTAGTARVQGCSRRLRRAAVVSRSSAAIA